MTLNATCLCVTVILLNGCDVYRIIDQPLGSRHKCRNRQVRRTDVNHDDLHLWWANYCQFRKLRNIFGDLQSQFAKEDYGQCLYHKTKRHLQCCRVLNRTFEQNQSLAFRCMDVQLCMFVTRLECFNPGTFRTRQLPGLSDIVQGVS